ncbi:hypothetical protein GQ54DRAFT_48883 [Martensiomyces pterosporus]|nr:hypothetical protein GQ54DRAFT_48883 [Martensiomyces pterosporus]
MKVDICFADLARLMLSITLFFGTVICSNQGTVAALAPRANSDPHVPGDAIGPDVYYDFTEMVFDARRNQGSKVQPLLMTEASNAIAQNLALSIKDIALVLPSLPALFQNLTSSNGTLLVNQGKDISSVMQSWLDDRKCSSAISQSTSFTSIGLGKVDKYWVAYLGD